MVAKLGVTGVVNVSGVFTFRLVMVRFHMSSSGLSGSKYGF